MSDRSCHTIGDLLVPYCDGELPDREADRVAAHLAECPGCRSELRLLERSLEAAKAVWRESAARAPMPGALPVRPGRRRIAAAACVGAACVAAACIVLLWWTAGDRPFSRRGPGSETARTEVPYGVEEVEAVEVEQMDVEAIIAREARAARLAVSVELLASQPGLDEYRDQAAEYLAETYGVVTFSNAKHNPIHN